MGLNSSLSSSTSEQVCEKKGGGGGNKVDSDGSTLGNRMMRFDHTLRFPDFKVWLDLAGIFWYKYEFKFLESLVTYPPTKR